MVVYNFRCKIFTLHKMNFIANMTFEKHLRFVHRAEAKRIGIMKWNHHEIIIISITPGEIYQGFCPAGLGVVFIIVEVEVVVAVIVVVVVVLIIAIVEEVFTIVLFSWRPTTIHYTE